MADLAAVEDLSVALDQINTLAARDTTELIRALEGLSPEQQNALLLEAFLPIVSPYAMTVGDLTLEFYGETRAADGVTTPYRPTEAVTPTTRRVLALAGWGAAALPDGNAQKALSRLTGGVQRVLFDVERDTIVEVAANDDHPVSYQRIARPGACAFCATLASRGAAFDSDSATTVVGRGVPVPTPGTRRGLGGIGKGVRPRGARLIGEKYHDSCRCVGVPLHNGNRQELNAEAAKWFDAYAEARDLANTDRKATGKSWGKDGQWADWAGASKEHQRAVLANMRAALNTS